MWSSRVCCAWDILLGCEDGEMKNFLSIVIPESICKHFYLCYFRTKEPSLHLSSHSVLRIAVSSSDTGLLSYCCMASAFHFCRITWACKLASSGATHPFSPHCFPLLIMCAIYFSFPRNSLPLQCVVSLFIQGHWCNHYSVGSDSPPLTLAFLILTKCSKFLPFWLPLSLWG